MSLIKELASRNNGWKVLILDTPATKVLNCCLRMQDITELGEVEFLIRDYISGRKYTEAHVFFLSPCPQELLKQITRSQAMNYIKTLTQLELDFIPVESHIFTLDTLDIARISYLPSDIIHDKINRLEEIAEQLASVCSALHEYPKICYQKTETNLDLARLVQTKLSNLRNDNPKMGQGSHKDKSVLLIVDRSFDPVSPLLHELTLQAMCYDLLPIENNTYTYANNRKVNVTDEDALWKEYRHQHIAVVTKTLPERVRQFAESKKQFMAFEQANASKSLSDGTSEDGSELSTNPKDAVSLRDLSNILKRMPQYQTESASYSAAFNIVETSMGIFQRGVDKLCDLEQNLVMGENAQGDLIEDPMRDLVEVFKIDSLSVEDRLRLLLIFALVREGLTEGHLDKLLEYSQVGQMYKPLFVSLSLVTGAQLIQPDQINLTSGGQMNNPQVQLGRYSSYCRLKPIANVSNTVQTYLPVKKKRVNRVDTNSYALSRWTPYLLDIMELIIEGKLDESRFRFLTPQAKPTLPDTRLDTPTTGSKAPSARFQPNSQGYSNAAYSGNSSPFTHRHLGGLGSDKSTIHSSINDHCGPRLIVYVVGGLTWSESRSVYQLTQKCVETRLTASDRSSSRQNKESQGISKNSTCAGGGGVGWNWEVVAGSTHMLTPKLFLEDLEQMAKIVASNVASTTRPSTFK